MPHGTTYKDMTGQRFGRLTVLREAGVMHSAIAWLCKCDCGGELRAYGPSLRKGATKSCGCLVKEKASARMTTHGKSDTPAHRSWAKMKDRCLNPRHQQFADYGGRGITICEPWIASFDAFLADMGERPAGTTLDRIDNNKGYEPGNCRWATRVDQNRNARHVRRVIRSDGREYACVGAALEDVGGSEGVMRRACKSGRLYLGFTWRFDDLLGVEPGATAKSEAA